MPPAEHCHVTNWYSRTLTVPSDQTVEVGDRRLSIERWFETVGQAWEAARDLNTRALVLRERFDATAARVTRAFQVLPSDLEPAADKVSVFFADMDANGVGGQPTIMPLPQIDAIGIVVGRLPLAIQQMQLDEHVGECVMLQIRHGAPNSVPGWTFHGMLRRLPNFAYALDAPDHTYGMAGVANPAVRFEFIAIAAATRCPTAHAGEGAGDRNATV